jgi:PncC family amidohydrolase
MAEGVRRNFGAAITVSVTGIAGPTGGSEAKPVGTVWLATAADGGTEAVKKVFGGSRADIRARAAQAALWLMLQRMSGP